MWHAHSGRGVEIAITTRENFKLREEVRRRWEEGIMVAIDMFRELLQSLRKWHIGYP